MKNTEFIENFSNLENLEERVKLVEFIKNEIDNSENIEDAEIIVSGGKGVKDFKMLEELAKLPVRWFGGADLSKMYDLTAGALVGLYGEVLIIIPH